MSVKYFMNNTKLGKLLSSLDKYDIQLTCPSHENMIPVYVEYGNQILEGEYRFAKHPDKHPFFYNCLYFPQLKAKYGQEKFESIIRQDKTGQLYAILGREIVKLYSEYPMPDIGSLKIE